MRRLLHFLFTAPRYHTNQHFAVKALLDAGHRVSFLALRREHSEVYDALHPTILGESIATRAIQSRRIGIPPLPDFWKQMRKLKPDVVIARDPNTAYGLLSAVVGRLMGANVIFYSQTPVHRRLNWWETVHAVVSGSGSESEDGSLPYSAHPKRIPPPLAL